MATDGRSGLRAGRRSGIDGNGRRGASARPGSWPISDPPPAAARSAARSASPPSGVLDELVTACAGGGALVAWALHLHASAALVGAILALPALAQTVQIPAARLTARLGARRTAVASGVVTAKLPGAVAVGGGVAVRKLVFAAGGAARLGAAALSARVFRRERA